MTAPISSSVHARTVSAPAPSRATTSVLALLAGLLVAMLALAPSVLAAPGDLDASFGSGGLVSTDFNEPDHQDADFLGSMALFPDDSIVSVGETSSSNPESLDNDLALARYGPNGALVESFSGDGTVVTDFDGDQFANAVAVQPDGKVIVGGGTYGEDFWGDFILARYTSDGSLDSSFSGDGYLTTNFGGEVNGDDTAEDVAIQSDGKIVAAGIGWGGSSSGLDFALARYNSDGSLDSTFSGDGRATVAVGDGFSEDAARAVALQDDGKLVVAGGRQDGDFAVARLLPNGSLDMSFAGDGVASTDFGSFAAATSMALQDDGKVVVAGWTDTEDGDFAVARYTTNGSLDTTFSGDGKETIDFEGGDDRAEAVAVQDNGEIVVGGSSDDVLALARLNPNGSLDVDFSEDGKTTLGSPAEAETAAAIAIQSNGSILAAGDNYSGGEFGEYDFALARFEGGGPPPPVQHALTVSTSGDGEGSVLSAPAGIDCGEACAAVFDEGEIVSLTATPSSDSTFTGWSGAGCSGTGICEVAMNSDLEVSATFAENEEPEEPENHDDPDDGDGASDPPPPSTDDDDAQPPAPVVRPHRSIAHAARRGLVRGNAVLVRARCVGDTACRAPVRLIQRIRVRRLVVRGDRRRPVVRTRAVPIAAGRLAIAPGTAGFIRLRLTRLGLRLQRTNNRSSAFVAILASPQIKNRWVHLSPLRARKTR